MVDATAAEKEDEEDGDESDFTEGRGSDTEGVKTGNAGSNEEDGSESLDESDEDAELCAEVAMPFEDEEEAAVAMEPAAAASDREAVEDDEGAVR